MGVIGLVHASSFHAVEGFRYRSISEASVEQAIGSTVQAQGLGGEDRFSVARLRVSCSQVYLIAFLLPMIQGARAVWSGAVGVDGRPWAGGRRLIHREAEVLRRPTAGDQTGPSQPPSTTLAPTDLEAFL